MKLLSKLRSYVTHKEIRSRLLVTLFLLLIFRILSKVPAPGIEVGALESLFGGSNTGGFFNTVNILAGGTLTQFSIISVGLIAFVNASIIMQLLGTIVPRIEQIQKMGEVGQKIINQWTRILTIPIAAIQSFGIYLLLKSNSNPAGRVLIEENLSTYRIVALVFALVGGAMLLMWIAELLSEKGLGGKKGGGLSVIITAGILASLPTSIARALSQEGTSAFLRNMWAAFGVENLIFFAILLIIILYILIAKPIAKIKNINIKRVAYVFYALLISLIPGFILFVLRVDSKFSENVITLWQNYTAKLNDVEIRFGFYLGLTLQLIALITFFNESYRKIPIKFVHRIRANSRASYEESSYLPIKILAPGVIPIIFATSLLLLPQVIYRFFGSSIEERFHKTGEMLRYASESWLNQQTSIYFHILQFILVVLFSFFYIFIIMKPEDIADGLKRNQSFIPNVRPGKETVDFISGVISRIAFWGGLVLGFLSALPFMLGIYNSTISSGMEAFIGSGTAILIVIASVLAVKMQMDALVLAKNYEQFEEI